MMRETVATDLVKREETAAGKTDPPDTVYQLEKMAESLNQMANSIRYLK